MALLSPQQITITGTDITYGAANASDTLVPDERAYLHYKNTNASTRTVTVVVPGTTFGQANPDVAVTLGATTGDEKIGPLPASLADPATGLITVTVSATAGVTVALCRV